MSKWVSSFIFLILWLNPFSFVSDMNQYQEEAFTAYEKDENPLAIALYQRLIQDYGLNNEAIHLNLAHAYYKAEVLDSAYKYYTLLTESQNVELQSISFMQMGLLMQQDDSKLSEESLLFLKKAIYASPNNLKARYNYELLLKKQKENELNPDKNSSENESKEEENNNNSNADAGNSSENTEQGAGEGEKTGQNPESEDNNNEDKPSPQVRLDKLEDMNLNPEKAEMILDAMKNQEIQYHQQRTRQAKKPRKSNRPNW